MVEEKRNNGVKVLHKAAAVLACFENQQEWSLTALSEQLGWHVATLHRILLTLEEIGYLQREKSSRRYRLGLKLIKLGLKSLEGLDLAKVAHPTMEDLSRRCGETVYLAGVQGEDVVYLDVVHPERPVRITADIGARRPLHSTGTGKVLLAYASPKLLAQVLSRPLPALTPHTITSRARLEQELVAIRQHGYAISFQEHSVDVASVAAPVLDATGAVVAALSVSAPAFRLPLEALHALAPTLKSAAMEISNQLGAATLQKEG